jgi:hypothetical protein
LKFVVVFRQISDFCFSFFELHFFR